MNLQAAIVELLPLGGPTSPIPPITSSTGRILEQLPFLLGDEAGDVVDSVDPPPARSGGGDAVIALEVQRRSSMRQVFAAAAGCGCRARGNAREWNRV